MAITTGQLAQAVNGKLIGSPSVVLDHASEIEQASKGALCFAFDKEHSAQVTSAKASAVLVTKEIKGLNAVQIVVKNGRLAMAEALALLYPESKPATESIHPSAVVSSKTKKGKNVVIGAHAVVEDGVTLGNNVHLMGLCYIGQDVSIGDDTVIYPQVAIYANTIIGKRVRIHAGCMVGIEGFGYVQHEGRNIKVPQVGKVVLEDDVELCGSVSIAHATIGETRIGEGTKVDALVHIGHNVTIGKHCIVVAHAAIGGNVTLGNNVIIAGKAGIADHVVVGDNSVVMANSAVLQDCAAGSVLFGFPAQEARAEKKKQVYLNKLEELFGRVKKLEKRPKRSS